MSDTLATYPYVVVRLACRLCSRRGQYRATRLAAKYGADVEMRALLEHLAGDCTHWRPRHPYREGCGAYFVDLEPPRPPPDLPPAAAMPLRVVRGGRP